MLEAGLPGSCTCTVTPAEELLKGKRICLLDPKAAEALAPEDGDLFDAFLYGGILVRRSPLQTLSDAPGR